RPVDAGSPTFTPAPLPEGEGGKSAPNGLRVADLDPHLYARPADPQLAVRPLRRAAIDRRRARLPFVWPLQHQPARRQAGILGHVQLQLPVRAAQRVTNAAMRGVQAAHAD